MNRPITTLFLLMSVDGKISTGDTDQMDMDKDLPTIEGVKEGLHQYYDIEKTTDYFSLISGKVFAKIGFNEKKDVPQKVPVVFVVIDNKPHLNENGVRYVAAKGERLIIVTTNAHHPAYNLKKTINNIEVLGYEKMIDFVDMFERLRKDFGSERVTIQSGGELNAEFVRKGLVDYVSVVVAPALIGGKDTSTLVDGESLHLPSELLQIKALQLEEVSKLEHSYIHLTYKVLH